MADGIMEIFSFLGAPARIVGRLPLITRYLYNGFRSPWPNPDYARSRYGKQYYWRPWLMFDVGALEVVEELINMGTDKEVRAFRQNQLDAFQMISVIGALVAGAALTAQQLPILDEVHYTARGFLTVSLVVALLATFFTCLQQRTYGFLENASAIRAWLTSGIQYTRSDGAQVFQSSVVAHQLLQVPFELICISITTFLAALGIMYGSALANKVKQGTLSLGQDIDIGNRGVLVAYVVATFFALNLMGQLLGGKDIEQWRCRKLTKEFTVSGNGLVLDEERRRSRELASPGPRTPRRSGEKGVFSDWPSPSQHLATQPAVSTLQHALIEAAAAHRACALADAEVARWLERKP